MRYQRLSLAKTGFAFWQVLIEQDDSLQWVLVGNAAIDIDKVRHFAILNIVSFIKHILLASSFILLFV